MVFPLLDVLFCVVVVLVVVRVHMRWRILLLLCGSLPLTEEDETPLSSLFLSSFRCASVVVVAYTSVSYHRNEELQWAMNQNGHGRCRTRRHTVQYDETG
jgi:hypothetical protein